MNSIHPVELVTQEALELPLESLGLQLRKLYESQLLVLSLLQNYEQKLTYYSQVSQEQHNSHLLIKTYNDRIYNLKLKLLKVSKTLDSCHGRVDRAMEDLID